MISDFTRGMFYLLKGVQALFTKGLKRFILLPLLFNFLLFSGLFYVIYHYLFPYSVEYLNQFPTWLHFLQGVFFILFFASFFLISLINVTSFVPVLNIIIMPAAVIGAVILYKNEINKKNSALKTSRVS